MAAIEELWEATHLPATLLNFQDPEDAQYSPDGPDNGSTLSEEDYVEMFTEIPSSEDFIDIAVLAEETEENSQEVDDITYVYEQDMVNALNSALNSALANYNILHNAGDSFFTLTSSTTNSSINTSYTSTISSLDVTNTWESWIEEAAVEQEISQLESEIQSLEEELASIQHEKKYLLHDSSNSFHPCLYSPLKFPSPLKRKLEIEEQDYSSEDDETYYVEEEEEEINITSNEYEYSSSDSEDSSSDSEEDSSEDESSSDSDNDSDSSSSSDESSEEESDSDSNSESEIEENAKTIYIPYKKRKVPISIFRQNRVKLIKTEEQDCEEDVDILN